MAIARLLHIALLSMVATAFVLEAAFAQDRGDPEHPFVKQLLPFGKMQGLLTCKDINHPEGFGATVTAIGDMNHDNLADWTVSRQRCDTSANNFGHQYYPLELLLYRGEQGRLPDAGNSERIGPAEIGSETSLLASGDWDADGNRDLAVRIHLFNDTSSGNIEGYDIATLVIFWGAPSGQYNINDTSRLLCDADYWIAIYSSIGADIDSDGVDDLVIRTSGGFRQGAVVPLASVQLFRGHRNIRWGREGISRRADWLWWTPPLSRYMKFLDQDCDGQRDIILYHDKSDGYAQVSVLYGQHNRLPDTSDLQSIMLDSANGHYSLFTDITGDGVPELAVNCGSQEKIKLFAGRPGQRLVEQYGTGNEPKNGKPWAEIWLPFKIHDGWDGAGFKPLYDLGDGNLDGISDLWAYSHPFLIEYNGGRFMDSLIDADFDIRGHLGGITSAVRLGDIDGSGTPTIALGAPGSLVFIKATALIPSTGMTRSLPHPNGFRCEHAADVNNVVVDQPDAPYLSLERSPGVRP